MPPQVAQSEMPVPAQALQVCSTEFRRPAVVSVTFFLPLQTGHGSLPWTHLTFEHLSLPAPLQSAQPKNPKP